MHGSVFLPPNPVPLPTLNRKVYRVWVQVLSRVFAFFFENSNGIIDTGLVEARSV